MSLNEMVELLHSTRDALRESRSKAWWTDQPRDERGKWATGNKGGGASGTKRGDLFGNKETPTPKEAQGNINNAMGEREHGFRAEEGEDGTTRLRHEDDPGGGVPIRGKSIFDTVLAMADYVDWVSSLAARSIGYMGKKLGKAVVQLHEVLSEWRMRA